MENLKDIQWHRAQVPPAKWSDVLLPPGPELDAWMKKHAIKAQHAIVEQAELFSFPVVKRYIISVCLGIVPCLSNQYQFGYHSSSY